VFDQVVSPGLLEITSLEQLTKIAKEAFELELPYQSFWAGMVNVLLINHQEFSLTSEHSSLVDFTYYILRALTHNKLSQEEAPDIT
jgi:hypothetical protein